LTSLHKKTENQWSLSSSISGIVSLRQFTDNEA
jgi:hypothetical protein